MRLMKITNFPYGLPSFSKTTRIRFEKPFKSSVRRLPSTNILNVGLMDNTQYGFGKGISVDTLFNDISILSEVVEKGYTPETWQIITNCNPANRTTHTVNECVTLNNLTPGMGACRDFKKIHVFHFLYRRWIANN